MYLFTLGGLRACSPRTFLLFVCSEINSDVIHKKLFHEGAELRRRRFRNQGVGNLSLQWCILPTQKVLPCIEV